MNHELTRTAAYAAKHAARALAQTLAANQAELGAEDAAELGAELREIFTSAQESLSMIEHGAADKDAAADVRRARYCAEDAVHALAHSYPARSTATVPASGDQFTPVTVPSEIEALANRRELIVAGAVYRVVRHHNGTMYVRDLADKQCISPEAFIDRFGQTTGGILLRH